MGFYGAFTGITGVCRGLWGGVSAAPTGQRAAETRRLYVPVSVYLMARFSIIRQPLCMVSLPLITV
jgi:hypothetical protein